VQECKEELTNEGLEFDQDMPIGAMIEVPAAAVCADIFARQLDFLSIGTNDLIQYTIAIDRVDDEVNYLYDPLHPAVLRLIQNTIKAGQKAGIPVANVPGSTSAPGLAQGALMFMIQIVTRYNEAQKTLNAGQLHLPMGDDLHGKTLGLIGFGASGQALAVAAHPLEQAELDKGRKTGVQHQLKIAGIAVVVFGKSAQAAPENPLDHCLAPLGFPGSRRPG